MMSISQSIKIRHKLRGQPHHHAVHTTKHSGQIGPDALGMAQKHMDAHTEIRAVKRPPASQRESNECPAKGNLGDARCSIK